MKKLLINATAIAALSLSLATPVLADANLDTVAPATVVRTWYQSSAAVVKEAVTPNNQRSCALLFNNADATFGVSTTGPAVWVWLKDYLRPAPAIAGDIRIQIDSNTPWRINTAPDAAVPSILSSKTMSDASAPQFIRQIVVGDVLRVQTADTVHTFSLATSAAALQATIACESSITGHAPTVRPTAPATRDLIL